MPHRWNGCYDSCNALQSASLVAHTRWHRQWESHSNTHSLANRVNGERSMSAILSVLPTQFVVQCMTIKVIVLIGCNVLELRHGTASRTRNNQSLAAHRVSHVFSLYSYSLFRRVNIFSSLFVLNGYSAKKVITE